MRLAFVILLVLLVTNVIEAQRNGGITGTVTRQGKPVSGVGVTLSPKQGQVQTTISDQSGVFDFPNLPPGKYEVFVPYATVKVASTVNVNAGATENVRLDMTIYSSGMSESVTVSAGEDQLIAKVSKTVNVIDGQEMRDRADFTLVDTVRSIPGFRIQQLGGFGRTANIKTRGLRNQDTAVLIDGVRFRDAGSITGDASPFLSDFTLTSVSKIEVLRGSGSSLYGTNAIGGVIDFQTPEPQQGWHGQVSGALGGLGLERFRGNISSATKDGKFGFNAGISRTVYTKGIDGDDDANNTNFQSKVNFRPISKTTISARLFVSDAFVRLNSDPDVVMSAEPSSRTVIIEAKPNVTFIPDADDPDSFQASKFFDGQLSFTQIINSKLFIQGYYSGLKTSRKTTNGVLGVGPFQPFNGDENNLFEGTVHTANAHLSWSTDTRSTFTAGYEFEYEKFGNDGFTADGSGNFFTRAYQTSNTFYVQDLLSLLHDRLQLAGGFRAQLFHLQTPKFSVNSPYSNVTLENPPTAYTFDGSASYFFPKIGTKLRAHIGNGYRVPSSFERFGTFFNSFDVPPGFVPEGDPNLKPERSLAADAGIEQYFLRDKVKLTAVYFYTKLIDTIGFGNSVPNIGSTPRPFGGYENQKGGIARGAEFSGTFKLTRSTDVFASYTFTNSDQRKPQLSGTGVIRSFGIPDHQFTLVATQRIEKFWVTFDFLGSSSYLAPIFGSDFSSFVYRFQGNRRGDLTAGYNFGWKKDRLNLRVFGTIENIFDDRYFENGFRTAGRSARVGISLGF